MSHFANSFCRFYMGRRPVIAVSDPVILEKILVKDFQHFHNRPVRIII